MNYFTCLPKYRVVLCKICYYCGALRDFVCDQLGKAQAQLEKLLLVHPQETREDLDIRFWIHRVVDDPSENQKGWSYLRHPQDL